MSHHVKEESKKSKSILACSLRLNLAIFMPFFSLSNYLIIFQ